jgi:hypothetical protein
MYSRGLGGSPGAMFPERDEYCDEQDSYYDDRKYLFLIVCAKTQKSLLSKIPGGIPLLGIHNDIILLTRWFNGHLAAVMVVEYRTKDSIHYDDNEQQQSFLRRLIDAVETSAPPFLVVCDESGTLHVGKDPWIAMDGVIAPTHLRDCAAGSLGSLTPLAAAFYDSNETHLRPTDRTKSWALVSMKSTIISSK